MSNSRIRQANRADRAFRAHIDSLRVGHAPAITGLPMSDDELAAHLHNRSRGGRKPNKRAQRKAGCGKGNRRAARAAAVRDW